jgi:thioredoxin-dependent peroxiredoxin
MLKEGDRAPAFSLLTDEGKKLALKDLKGKTVVLYFYPKDNTPGCTQEACDFRDAFPRFTKGKAAIVGISKDSVESHVKFKQKFEIPFPLLADTEGKICEAYGVWQMKTLYGRKFMGIVRTTVVVGPDGKVQKIYPKVKVKGHATQVLRDLSGIASE